jgi:hypothetical protein
MLILNNLINEKTHLKKKKKISFNRIKLKKKKLRKIKLENIEERIKFLI